MKVLGIIPARFGSTRLEGKPLLDIHGKTMISRVYEQTLKATSISDLYVATDSKLIEEECLKNKIPCIMTSESHKNGTERCAEVLKKMDTSYDIVINIQGDEPFINPISIEKLLNIFHINKDAQIGTLKKAIDVLDGLKSPNNIKVVTDKDDKALYFSRSPIPFLRDVDQRNWLENNTFYKHVGLYAYTSDILPKLVSLEESDLEKNEKLEQLRWLENGYSIHVAETDYDSESIDTKEDYDYIIKNFHKYNND